MDKVNKEIKKLYFDILRKMLEEPEKWESNHSGKYSSPYISKDTCTRFETKYFLNDAVYITENNFQIYQLNFNFFDLKTRILISKLRKYHEKIEKETKINQMDEKLMRALGYNSTRFFKLMKIKNKI